MAIIPCFFGQGRDVGAYPYAQTRHSRQVKEVSFLITGDCIDRLRPASPARDDTLSFRFGTGIVCKTFISVEKDTPQASFQENIVWILTRIICEYGLYCPIRT
ncbi:MAG: hypothetical protein LBR26_10350 [Prevotella sp.]|nr:hypothetical protein [Prevotella sp.]